MFCFSKETKNKIKNRLMGLSAFAGDTSTLAFLFNFNENTCFITLGLGFSIPLYYLGKKIFGKKDKKPFSKKKLARILGFSGFLTSSSLMFYLLNTDVRPFLVEMGLGYILSVTFSWMFKALKEQKEMSASLEKTDTDSSSPSIPIHSGLSEETRKKLETLSIKDESQLFLHENI